MLQKFRKDFKGAPKVRPKTEPLENGDCIILYSNISSFAFQKVYTYFNFVLKPQENFSLLFYLQNRRSDLKKRNRIYIIN